MVRLGGALGVVDWVVGLCWGRCVVSRRWLVGVSSGVFFIVFIRSSPDIRWEWY